MALEPALDVDDAYEGGSSLRLAGESAGGQPITILLHQTELAATGQYTTTSRRKNPLRRAYAPER
ncbi:hypothetical protein ACQEU8_00885 [Streptomyces sp. CA-250714]|uniref:hypothetical protein n=1 Tax=Streptomyces sp. CA-250714 TaxID=3240060 RepID=UPI003D942548